MIDELKNILLAYYKNAIEKLDTLDESQIILEFARNAPCNQCPIHGLCARVSGYLDCQALLTTQYGSVQTINLPIEQIKHMEDDDDWWKNF